ncbi:MAG: C40 family peptidase [Ornithinibacter sp.]
MHEITRSGRHRGAARYNPAAELSTIVKSAGQTGIKVSAVLAASGGLVAAFALPAQAATPAAVSTVSTADTTAGVQALTAAPGVQALALAPAVVAPAAAAPALTDVVGVSGVTAVAKPKPKPKPKPAPVVQAVSARSDQSGTASRSTSPTRNTSTRSSPPKASPPKSSSQTTAPAPSRNVPAGTSGVVNIARTLLGIPYVYGGSTPSGFDCSGLTQYVFAKAGKSIPRTASAQQRAATPVSNPQPGDLVFYGSPAWHVGIYTGNGMMIDSPRPGKFSSERKMFSGVTGYGRF